MSFKNMLYLFLQRTFETKIAQSFKHDIIIRFLYGLIIISWPLQHVLGLRDLLMTSTSGARRVARRCPMATAAAATMRTAATSIPARCAAEFLRRGSRTP